MNKSSIILAMFCVLLVQVKLEAQYAFRHLNKMDGLSQNSVFSIAQDKQGFMWFGTRDGLNRYDGYKMVVYRQKESDSTAIAGNDIRCLYYDDQKEQLWIGTSTGLSLYRSAQDDFINFLPGEQPGALLGGSIRTILCDRQGRLWVGTNRGLHLYNDEEMTFRVIRGERGAPGEISSHNIRVLFEDLSGQLWVGTNNGLNVWDPTLDGFRMYYHDPADSSSLPGKSIHDIKRCT